MAMTKIIETARRRHYSIYLTKEDLADMLGVEAFGLSVSHVDRAPDSDDAAVRITLLEDCDTAQAALFGE
jgi:hypothetical protein